MKFHANDLIICKLREAQYLIGTISKVVYANEEDWKNERPHYIHLNGSDEDIYMADLVGRQVYHVPTDQIDDFIRKNFID